MFIAVTQVGDEGGLWDNPKKTILYLVSLGSYSYDDEYKLTIVKVLRVKKTREIYIKETVEELDLLIANAQKQVIKLLLGSKE